ncbi:glycosyltransferase family 2 protein [Paraburkholderia sp. GAS334]|uniref:glycosyltransferase family 2 protein n=1 Tax=Paraburkholderia sp. GAS334 TaxID=3035131 RepID=UPI003D1A343A
MSSAPGPAVIDIALATWNGARYLPEMLESINAQTFPDWRLVVRDDGSADATRSIIDAFAARFPTKVTIVEDVDGRLGAAGNFNAATRVCTAPYVAFADQDDFWLPEKLDVTLKRMLEIEHLHGASMPVLVHTDLRVVDVTLGEIAPSYVGLMRLDPVAGTRLERLLMRNVVTGCAMLSNRALVDLATPLPSGAVLHDWWFALVASCVGSVEFVNLPTILYRQHSDNAIGTGGAWSIQQRGAVAGARGAVRRRYRQAEALLSRIGAHLTPRSQKVLTDYIRLEHQGLCGRAWRIFRRGYWDHGMLRTIAAVLWG